MVIVIDFAVLLVGEGEFFPHVHLKENLDDLEEGDSVEALLEVVDISENVLSRGI